MREIPGDRNAYYAPDLLVALEHVGRVCAKLDDLGVPFLKDGVERSPDLGLALVRLREEDDGQTAAGGIVEGALEELARGKGLIAENAAQAIASRPTTFSSDLDRFLWALRAHFAAEYAGWSPTLGKNRLLGNVVGGGKISHGGGPGPQMVTRDLPPRAAGPGQGVRVGVLDTSVSEQPWLAGGWVGPGTEVLAASSEHPAVAGHATFVTGLILGQAPGCAVELRQVLSDENGEAESWAVANKIVELGRTGIDVLNLSMVCYTEDGQPPLVLATAVDRLDPDTVVVAAAGNHGNLDPEPSPGDRRKAAWPAALDDVVAVGAAHGDARPAELTPRNVPWIDVHATGVDVVSTYLEGDVRVPLNGGSKTMSFTGFAQWDGTSFAAALVSGAIAARTVPGRVPAREAWRQLLSEAVESPDGDPPFLPLQGL